MLAFRFPHKLFLFLFSFLFEYRLRPGYQILPGCCPREKRNDASSDDTNGHTLMLRPFRARKWGFFGLQELWFWVVRINRRVALLQCNVFFQSDRRDGSFSKFVSRLALWFSYMALREGRRREVTAEQDRRFRMRSAEGIMLQAEVSEFRCSEHQPLMNYLPCR